MFQISTHYNIDDFNDPNRKPFTGNMLYNGDRAFHIKEKDHHVILHWKDNESYLPAIHLYNFLDTIPYPFKMNDRKWDITRGVTSTDMVLEIPIQEFLELFNTN